MNLNAEISDFKEDHVEIIVKIKSEKQWEALRLITKEFEKTS